MVNELRNGVKSSAYIYGLVLLADLIGAAAICFYFPQEDRSKAWLLVLALMIVGFALIGKAITGLWKGILIDSRNKISLSRLQLFSWSLIVFSGLLVATVFNARVDWSASLDITIPEQLWIVMGLATSSAVAAPVILNNRGKQRASQKQIDTAADTMAKQEAQAQNVDVANVDVVDRSHESVVVRYQSPKDARWADLFKGEELSNFVSVDTGKTQLFLLSFVLILAYGTTIYMMLKEPGTVTSLPEVKEGLNVLLGISQTGYLAIKTIPHTAPPAPQQG